MRSSRRIPPLTDEDIDHEINIVDHDNSTRAQEARPLSAQTNQTTALSASDQPFTRSESQARLTQHMGGNGILSHAEQPDAGPSNRETAIDILYENQRGGFLCGIPLFSSAALGNLDPPAWTNFAHKPSPTDIHTAQVPDPSWEWAWPEWRINHDDQIEADGDGWEYSFMFSKKFSWHGPKWYNSFVRRRAWIRRRIKRGTGYQAEDEHEMDFAYFTVTAKKQERSPSATVNEMERVSMDIPSATAEVKTAEDLMTVLRRSRIDREKLDAVENYIANCTDDLLQLQEHMHEIMSVFVFQASRRLLLARLTQLHDDVIKEAHNSKSGATRKAEHLVEAIKHADEEVQRLEYWSDIKEMAENGEAARAIDYQKGWDTGWQGLDKSGAKGIKEDQLP
ncbi:hypothetical protein F5Y19DRAFT_467810 [Xylariaceae sp. FL1651]|nr:hypothetical protein F5Y19DRAFT_467810 [Xylariaceae sp. FL1651]